MRRRIRPGTLHRLLVILDVVGAIVAAIGCIQISLAKNYGLILYVGHPRSLWSEKIQAIAWKYIVYPHFAVSMIVMLAALILSRLLPYDERCRFAGRERTYIRIALIIVIAILAYWNYTSRSVV